MKRYAIRNFALMMLFAAPASLTAGGLGPRLERLVREPARTRPERLPGALRKTAQGWSVDAIITFDGRARDLRRAGARLICVRVDMAVARIPLGRLAEVAEAPGVIYIEGSAVDRAQLDRSVPLVNGLRVRSQLGLTGKGVIVGIIDSGLDLRHSDFRKADGSTRVLALLDLSRNGPVYGGTLYTGEQIDRALAGSTGLEQNDYSGHGTHVTGIAAGDGSESAGYGSYAGMAPEADLVIVKATRDEEGSKFQTSDQILALAFIDSLAGVLDRPYVANLSFGGHLGGHDGSSAAERFIDRLTGRGIPGKAVVTVAGNSRREPIHASTELDGAGPAEFAFEIAPYRPGSSGEADRVQLDGWYDGGAGIKVTLISPAGTSHGPVVTGSVYEEQTAEGTIYIWNGFYDAGSSYKPGVNPFNGDREFYIEISGDEPDSPPASGEWRVRFTGNRATIDAWLVSSALEASFTSSLSESGLISIPGTAKNAITVGAFISKKTWEYFGGGDQLLTFDPEGQYEIGDLSDFSSPGPARDGRVKPEINAPGQIIASSYSDQAPADNPISIFYNTTIPNAFVLPDDRYALSTGTSMAAPHVVGVIALILQQYPEASATQIREMLIQSAQADGAVGPVPNDDWGWGKLDAYRALQLSPGVEPPAQYRLLQPYPNPFTSVTAIEFELPVTSSVPATRIQIYNILGQRVRTLLNQAKSPSRHRVFWDGRDDLGYPLASGIYFIQLQSGSYRARSKVLHLAPGS